MKSSPWVVCCVAFLCLQYVRSEGDSGEYNFDDGERHGNEKYDDIARKSPDNAEPVNYCKEVCGLDPKIKCDDPYKEKELKDCGCHDSYMYYRPSKKSCHRQCRETISGIRCENGGKCVQEGQKKFCDCPEGTTGDYCRTITECNKSLKRCRLGNGLCTFEDGKATCKCILNTKFYEKEGYCEEQCTKDEDCMRSKLTKQGKFCNEDGFCECPEGFENYHCSIIRGCLEMFHTCRKQNAACVYDKNAENKATCICKEKGFTYDPKDKQCKRN